MQATHHKINPTNTKITRRVSAIPDESPHPHQPGHPTQQNTNQPTGSPNIYGGVVSPILSNIYLDKLDKFVEQVLIPQYTQEATGGITPSIGG